MSPSRLGCGSNPATVICGPATPSPASLGGRVLYVGLDVHNDSIAISLGAAPEPGSAVLRDHWRAPRRRAATAQEACRHASGRGVAVLLGGRAGGYPLCRFIRAHGAECIIVAPSRVPRQPGDRVKADRRDTDPLARLLRAGELTGICVPDLQDVAVRDLILARYQVQKQQRSTTRGNSSRRFCCGRTTSTPRPSRGRRSI